MTKSQIEALKALIFSRLSEVPEGHLARDWRLVEVSAQFGIHPATAQSLVEAGLAVEDMPSWATQHTNTHLRLPEIAELKQWADR